MTPPTLIRTDYLITDPDKLDRAVIRDAALVIADGVVRAAGPWAELAPEYVQLTPALTGKNQLIVPGLVNAHHHGRAFDTRLMGMQDKPLELWLPNFILYPALDTYQETLLSALQMLRGGVTTSLQAHSAAGPFEHYRAGVLSALKAYDDAGVRVAFAPGHYDQHFLVHADERSFARTLPHSLVQILKTHFDPEQLYITADDYFALFQELQQTYHSSDRIRLLLNPIGLHWASDTLLRRTADGVQRYQTGLHLHLLETLHQRSYAYRTFGKSAARVLSEYGLLGEHCSLAHAIWSEEQDIALYAATGTTITTNPSSNLRLGSGLLPLRAMLEQGVPLAIGTDSMSLNSTDDLLADLTLLQVLHHQPGHRARTLSPFEALQFATTGGAKAAGLSGVIGKLLPGYQADMTVLGLGRFQIPDTEIIGVALGQMTAADVTQVMVGGKVLVEDGKLTQHNIEALRQELLEQIPIPATDKRSLLTALEPHLIAFYQKLERDTGEPFAN
jgi:5-methylthioadenosine/S-adenosylhomocysteine deaminase